MVVLSLQGCFVVFVGGVLVIIFVVIDCCILGVQMEDKVIVVKGEVCIFEVVVVGFYVNVMVFNCKVLFLGEVLDEVFKVVVECEIKVIQNVDMVYNELEVGLFFSFGLCFSDVFIISKVLVSLVDDKMLYFSVFKIIIECGIVYMLGCVIQCEGQCVVQIVSGVFGVNKVVILFEYIIEDELKDYQCKLVSENKVIS